MYTSQEPDAYVQGPRADSPYVDPNRNRIVIYFDGKLRERKTVSALLPRPLAIDEDRGFGVISCNAPDIEVIGPHHKVNVRMTLVHASGYQLVLVHRKAAFHALGEAHAQR